MSERKDYVDALNAERETLLRRPDSPTRIRRLAEVDAELGKYGDDQAKRRLREVRNQQQAPVGDQPPAE
jgi:hypothetical protein